METILIDVLGLGVSIEEEISQDFSSRAAAKGQALDAKQMK